MAVSCVVKSEAAIKRKRIAIEMGTEGLTVLVSLLKKLLCFCKFF